MRKFRQNVNRSPPCTYLENIRRSINNTTGLCWRLWWHFVVVFVGKVVVALWWHVWSGFVVACVVTCVIYVRLIEEC